MSFVEEMQELIGPNELLYFVEEDPLKFFINCNDFFFWGCADGEPIVEETFEELKAAIQEVGVDDGPLLYACRRRQMRPQNAMYCILNKANHKIFDACGPEREIDFLNPEEKK